MNLQLEADTKERWGIGGKWRLGSSENAGKNSADLTGLRRALAVLQPRFITMNEPTIEGFSGPQNDFHHARGSVQDSRCAGHAWNESDVPAGRRHKYPYDRLLRIHDRYRRGMLLVQLAEQRDGTAYAWVILARPDLVITKPFTERFLRHDAACIFPQSHVDAFAVVARPSADSVFVESTLSYWRCEQIHTSWNEKWLGQACATAAQERGQCVDMRLDPHIVPAAVRCSQQGTHAYKDLGMEFLRDWNRSSKYSSCSSTGTG
jgi:hypothetical protein